MLTRVISVLLLAAIAGFHPDHDSEAVEAGRLTQGPSLPTTCDVGQLFVNTIASAGTNTFACQPGFSCRSQLLAASGKISGIDLEMGRDLPIAAHERSQ